MSVVSVVGMSCVYPGAQNIVEFWENIVTRRRSFRRIPEKRLNLRNYGTEDRSDRDRTYATRAAVIDRVELDWRKNKVPRATYEATDPSHWLALGCAYDAIADATIDLDAVDRSRIGVIVGNSLTGEISRSNLMRLRWPFVQEAIVRGARASGVDDDTLRALLSRTETAYKAPFHAPNEDTLAGALSNVIAGRICNRLDLHGGGYTVDGACASSLLAVRTGCDLLMSRQLDIVLAGGVDISLDPLELVGFARTGALTSGEMLVYDHASSGFIPGEGCGFAVLMRSDDATEQGYASWAEVAGWGISSDGAGGITAPKAETQALAIQRCYAGAEFGPRDLDFVEGHGTGTLVGDVVELESILSQVGESDAASVRTVGVTSVKTLIGHTKAAAGIAGFLKAVLAVNQRVMPPMAGPRTPHELFRSEGARIYPIRRARLVAGDRRMRAGISSAGFGGINCHVAVTAGADRRRALPTVPAEQLAASQQSAEVIVASAPSLVELRKRLAGLAERADGMAEGELADFAMDAAFADRRLPVRVAVTLDCTDDVAGALRTVAGALSDSGFDPVSLPHGARFGVPERSPRIGFLFPGQGSQFLEMGWRLRGRHHWARRRAVRWNRTFRDLAGGDLTALVDRPQERCFDEVLLGQWKTRLRDTRVAQPAIAMTALQWADFLQHCGIEPAGVAGHSLGEIPALVVSDVLSESEAMDLLKIRADAAAPPDGEAAGAMIGLRCPLAVAEALLTRADGHATVANINAPDQIVVAGDAEAIHSLRGVAEGERIGSAVLDVQNAFHSRYMEGAGAALRELAGRRAGDEREALAPFYSAVRGAVMTGMFNPWNYLAEQVVAPVHFMAAIRALAGDVDVMIEMGPGEVLAGLARMTLGADAPVLPLETASSNSDARMCDAFGALYVAGAGIDWRAFHAGRLLRPFAPASERRFWENPCELPGEIDPDFIESTAAPAPADRVEVSAAVSDGEPGSVGGILRELIVAETGYGLDMMPDDARLIRDLNLDSIKVGEIRARLKARGITFAEESILSEATIGAICEAAIVEERPAASAPAVARPAPELPVLGLAPRWEGEAPPDAVLPGDATIVILGDGPQAGALCGALRAAGFAPSGPSDPSGAVDTASADLLVVVLPALEINPGLWDPAAARALAALLQQAGPAFAAAKSVAVVGMVAERADEAALPAAAIAQSLSLELPSRPVLGISADAERTQALAAWITRAHAPGAHPLRLGPDGGERLRLDIREPGPAGEMPCGKDDVILSTGGAKGITAECTFALARATGARVALAGTSDPATDREVHATLARYAEAGLAARYFRCDVRDPAAVAALMADVEAAFGGAGVAGMLHGAGVNIPSAADSLSAEEVDRELAVKCGGFANLLAALDRAALRFCVAFGSVIGVTGMNGNIGYAAANAVLSRQVGALRAERPAVTCGCIAYGAWDEIGMGAKLGVIDWLRARDVHPIPPAVGVDWLLRTTRTPGLPMPLVVSGPMHGLSTWRAARRAPEARAGDFLRTRMADEPGVLMVARRTLSVAADPWLADHDFNGSFVMPLVFVLNGMGQAAAAVTGGAAVRSFGNIEISSPIIVPTDSPTEIEVDFRAAGAGGVASVGPPGEAHLRPNFRAELVLGAPEPAQPLEPLVCRGVEVGPRLGDRLYDWLLFQGPLFRRIEALTHVDYSDDVRRRAWLRLRRDAAAGAVTPDPYFLDSMLQAMQILVPRDVCLPSRVGGIVFAAGAFEAGVALVRSEIVERTDEGYVGRVVAVDPDNGELVARIDGLRLDAVSRDAARPDLPDIIRPLDWDRSVVAAFADAVADVSGEAFRADLGPLDVCDRDGRRAAARAQIAGIDPALAPALDWRADGGPMFAPDGAPGVSIAHDGANLLTVLGEHVAGCDLQAVDRRRAAWRDLLPKRRQALLTVLTGELGDPRRAGALARAVDEAMIKAGRADAPATVVARRHGVVEFEAGGYRVFGALVELSTTGPAAVCVAFGSGDGRAPVVDAAPAAPGRITHFLSDRRMSFRDALPPLRTAPAPVFFGWMGELREEAMEDVRASLADAFENRSRGILTNLTAVRVHRPPSFVRPVKSWVTLDRVLDTAPSTFELRFLWAQEDEGGDLQACAEGRQRLTWVRLGAGGTPEIEPFPPFFAEFIARRTPAAGEIWTPPVVLPEPAASCPVSALDGRGSTSRLRADLDESHSNLVGNVYFSHFATLAERTCRKTLREVAPAAVGFYCNALRLDHVGEAMPGDAVEVAAYHRGRVAGGHVFRVEIVDASREDLRICVGEALFDEVPAAPAARRETAA